jgi:hypothetical protein
VQGAHCLEHLQLIDNINFVSATLCCYQGHEARAYIEIESFPQGDDELLMHGLHLSVNMENVFLKLEEINMQTGLLSK